MIYKCARCKTSKSFVNPAPTATAYCDACKCRTLFLPDASPTFAVHPPPRHTPSTFASGKKFGTSTSSLHRITDRPDDERRPSIPRSMASASASLVRSSSSNSIRPCDYFKLCLEFMLSLECSKRLFNRKHNRCYCQNCYPACNKDFYIEGGTKYVIPRGWVRFGLYIDDAQAEAEQIWRTWVVSYHGTNPHAAKSIIEHHLFLLPGDRSISGHVIGIVDGHISGKFQVYTSPTIAYSGDDIYSPSTSFRSRITGKTYNAKIVLQCRQQPRSFKIQAETIGANAENRRICPIIPNSEVEYFTEVRSSIVPYGLLIRIF